MSRRIRQAQGVSHACLALALSLGFSQAARAQSFDGSATVVSGSAFVSTSAGATNVSVSSPRAVINWVPTDTTGTGNVNFQPAGTTTTFQGLSPFAVLNRILPANGPRAVELNGSIVSQVLNPPSGPYVPGGAVWFYSPGGIVVGSTATFDVGSLVLTTGDPVVDVSGEFFSGNAMQLQAALPGSYVTIQPGAQITMTPTNSYMAVFAPAIAQRGAVNMNGSAAYVAAEAGTLTINNGLFDIQVSTGTDGNGSYAIDHSGSTTGSISSGPTDRRRVMMVAVPKNQAIQILAGGLIGFDVAGAADAVGHAVVLSGFRVNDKTINGTAGGTGKTNIYVDNASVTSDLTLVTEGDGRLSATGGNTARFYSGVNAWALNSMSAFADGAGSLLQFDLTATIRADAAAIPVIPTATYLKPVAGSAQLSASNGGSVVAMQAVNLSARSDMSGTPTALGPINATGGSAVAQAFGGGTLTIGTGLLVDASARGTNSFLSTSNGANAQGGDARLTASSSGVINIVAGGVTVASEATGGSGLGGGNGTGGTASVSQATGGLVTINGSSFVSASGTGGASLDSTLTARGGTGRGGDARFVNNDALLVANDDVFVSADGIGGSGGFSSISVGNGGDGIGGLANIGSQNAELRIVGEGVASADGVGGSAIFLQGSGGNGTGGQALVGTVAGAGAQINSSSRIRAHADATGGDGIGTAGAGGNANGGIAQVFAQSGTVSTVSGTTQVSARSQGGMGSGTGTAGNATTQRAEVFSQLGATVAVGGDLLVDGSARGGAAGSAAGGSATAGGATINAGTGTITVAGLASADATAQGGVSNGGVGGAGQGGSAFAGMFDGTVVGGGSFTVGGLLTVDGSATGGNGAAGGGNGTGGQALAFASQGGTVTLSNGVLVRSTGLGGNATSSGAGGIGSGNIATLGARNGTMLVNGALTSPLTGASVAFVVDASATGGQGAGGGAGGNAVGGTQPTQGAPGGAQVLALNSTAGPSLLRAGAGEAYSTATGGTGGSGATGGTGGRADGGTALISGSSGNGTLTMGALTANVSATGGTGGAGLPNGGAGGAAFGGGIQFGTFSDVSTPATAGSSTFGNVTALATGTGGLGGSRSTALPPAVAGNGGAGGDGSGGSVFLGSRGAPVTAGDVSMDSRGIGGSGGTGSPGQAAAGNASGGGAGIAVTTRSLFPATSGLVNIGNLSAVTGVSPGIGSGTPILTAGQFEFDILAGDVNAASMTFDNTGGVGPAATFPSRFLVSNGDLNVSGGVTMRTPGDVSVTVENGTATIGGTLTAQAGNYVPDPNVAAFTAPGPLTANSFAMTTGGNFVINALLGSATPLSLTAPGSVTLAGAASSGSLAIVANGGSVTAGSLSGGTGISVTSVPSSVTTGTLTGPGLATISAGTTATFGAANVGALNVSAAGDVTTTGPTNINGSGLIESTGGNVTLGDIQAGLTATAPLTIVAAGNLTAGTVQTSGELVLGARTGAINTALAVSTTSNVLALAQTGVTTTAQMQAGGRIYLANSSMLPLGGPLASFNSAPILGATPTPIAGPITIGSTLTASGPIVMSATGLIKTGGAVSAGNTASLTSGSGFDLGTVTIGTGLNLTATGGDVRVAGVTANGDIILAANAGNIAAGPLNTGSGANVNLTARGNIATSSVQATSNISASAGGVLTVNGAWSAPQISTSSANIDIGSAGSLGTASTTSLTLANSGTGATIIGGAPSPTSPTWQIDSAELSRLRAQTIAIPGGTGTRPTIEMRDFTVSGSATTTGNLVGPTGQMIIGSASPAVPKPDITVTGAARFATMADGNRVTLNGNAVQIVAETGSLRLQGNSPGGTLTVNAQTFYAASSGLLSQLASDPNFLGRSAAVGLTTGTGATLVEAKSVNLNIAQRLIVQNTGILQDLNGVQSYVGGVTITPTNIGPTGPIVPLDMDIYASVIDPATGLPLASRDVRDSIFPGLSSTAVSASLLFTPDSAINGCLLSAPRCGALAEALSVDDDLQEREDQNEREDDDAEANGDIIVRAASRPAIPPAPQIVNRNGLLPPRAIDEPVTGSPSARPATNGGGE